ncbi:MAG: glucosylceramidase [Bacteroidales bacterium]|nr:glucosylceramidase [Bacteroidales bacterium]
MFKKIRLIIYFLLMFLPLASLSSKDNPKASGILYDEVITSGVELWLTKADESVKFEKQAVIEIEDFKGDKNPVIEIDTTVEYQTIDGFGFALTGGSAIMLKQMSNESRSDILKELFSTEVDNIGTSYIRLSIGASDLSDHVFSYDDLPPGDTDEEMEHFTLDEDRDDVIPIMQEILEINPDIKILGSPWSPPTWMKTNDSSVGGQLKPQFYDAYAKYFVKYIQGMAEEGITIDAITVQNEPLHPGNNPSLLMHADQQAAFIKESLGPAFKEAEINTKIIVYDHNADRVDYPMSILDDKEARIYVDGSAFHLYRGSINDLSDLHEAHPDKNLYFTEQWVGAPANFAGDFKWHIDNLIIGATRNWCRNVIEWNLAADPNQDPHTEGGCTRCLGALTIDGNEVIRNPAFYIIAHASKFVRPGSVRIGSDLNKHLKNVAFKTPDGRKVVIVLNDGADTSFSIKKGNKMITTSLDSGDVGTFIW